ncbi:MAG: zinc ABC transporter solute-binding protein [Alphaproteobacteria bacterium]|nr:zinc ABC transporter solute-binding protein [Alphaproteobacteria bacterium]MBT5389178.1 zinc ABC transporter solute-binding protein [Alphaproteobacteria bacterium]MBT5540465.1 zinc ABC transporter solute-binding protein [Alphaproteobacteria bacterium]MBT5654710.1 zinc ABC transporter solute-binding protein [Alphaproteobacteria bacterium]
MEQVPLKAVATFSVLGDLLKAVGGEHVHVDSIVGPNGDAHVYEPSIRDAKALANADLVFTNGLGFEGWMNRLIEASGYKGTVIVGAKGVRRRYDPIQEKEILDPHAWHSISNVKQYIHNIAQALAQKDPIHADYYESRKKAYLNKLEDLDQWIRTAISNIPTEKRKIVTLHDGFGYFGEDYDVEFLAPLGMSTEFEPSAQDLVNLIQKARRYGIKVIFLENISSPKLMEQIASEADSTIGGIVYSDALSEPTEAAGTYLKMMKHNVNQFLQAMKASTGPSSKTTILQTSGPGHRH